ncbi:MAG: hypothetical protein ABI640_11425 [Gammaproteobacteria bacterium]
MPSSCSSNPLRLRSSFIGLTVALAASMAPGVVFGQAAQRPPAANSADTDRQALIDRIEMLEKRLSDLEQTAVLSAPKVLVKEVPVWVDKDGNQYDHDVPGAKKTMTYERELAHRRQTIEDEINDKLAEESANGISVGVNNVTTLQLAKQTRGADTIADGHAYGLSAADITFSGKSAALNTEFFADLVGIGGSPPESEIDALNLLNGQTARLSNNQLSVREAWLRTEVAHQRVGISVGRLDLTTHFDRNAAANDETTQFISDALVNNPVLGLSSNGFGIVAEYDPKKSFNFKLGYQQSNSDTGSSLHDSAFTLGEVEYVAHVGSLGEGHYRLWGRSDNSSGSKRSAYGLSVDQKISSSVTLFGRYGDGEVADIPGKEKFYSAGVAFGAPHTIHPNDFWGIGISHTDFELGPSEKLAEGFYNLYLTGHLRASFMLQYVLESATGAGYLLPGMRMQVVF